jgi:hypothetical protein
MLEILRTGYREASKNIFLLASNKDIPYRKRLAMMLEIPAAGMFANGTEDGGCLFGRIGLEIGSHFPVFNEVIQTHFNAYMKAFETIFLEALDEERAKELAKQAVVEMQGAVLLSIVYSDTSFYSEANQRILSWIH